MLLLRCRYEPNNLGDISFQPKFVTGEFSPQQWVTYFKKYTAKSWIQSAGRLKSFLDKILNSLVNLEPRLPGCIMGSG